MSVESVKHSVQEQFAAAAANYKVSAVHRGGPDLDAMIAAAGLTGRERVLDVGCGPGHSTLPLGFGAREVVGLDLTAAMVREATALAQERRATNVRYQRGDVEAMTFPDASFDVATCRVSAHHYPDPRRALAELRRVLRPGGRLLLVDSVAPEDDEQDAFLDHVERTRDGSHVRNWRISEWLEMMRSAGFSEASHLESFTMYLVFEDWVARMKTPPQDVATLRRSMAAASPAVREAFALEPNGNWRIPIALLRAAV